uniref:Uncharacterized protein n=1 Tax=Setaria viridis TaxID=4556 RepID=A0A4U6UW16_SETVI|nr:hypothetical protein SEVIR_4G113201v2 [Setaria viridis]
MTSKVSGAQSEASSPASSGELSTSSSTLEAALLSFANQSSTPKSREMGFSLTGRSFFFLSFPLFPFIAQMKLSSRRLKLCVARRKSTPGKLD